MLRGFDLRVAQGSIHALIGGNGCGKSTLLRVIAGVQKLDRGACVNVLVQRQALLPQDPKGLFVCDTVQEELSEWQHACGYADADVDAIAQAFGLAERLSNHPYDLSGGQQQQLLALAKLLLTKSSLLLLDELTKGLDPQTKCQVTKAIQEQARAGVTVVMATHDLPFAALVADEATMLFDGESAATQPVPEFFADNLFFSPSVRFLRQAMARKRGRAMKQYQKLQVDCTPSVPARKTRRMASILEPLVLILVPATLAVCAVCDYQQAALLTFVVAVAAIAVFFLGFERSKPALRQIMPTVVLAALAAAGRIIFAPIPDFKPVSAICIIAGATFGRQSGFMVGALAALVSNFFFGQGAWTPWQMYTWGLIGYISEIAAPHEWFDKNPFSLYGASCRQCCTACC